MTEFEPFNKIPRLNRECFVTEKLDGTNAVVYIQQKCLRCGLDYAFNKPSGDNKFVSCCGYEVAPPMTIHAGSKNKWIRIGEDNAGFAAWVLPVLLRPVHARLPLHDHARHIVAVVHQLRRVSVRGNLQRHHHDPRAVN